MSEEHQAHEGLDDYEAGLRKAKLQAHAQITRSQFWLLVTGNPGGEKDGKDEIQVSGMNYHGSWDILAGFVETAMGELPLMEAALLQRRIRAIMDEREGNDPASDTAG